MNDLATHDSPVTSGEERGCGFRSQGGVYATNPLTEDGALSIWSCIVDPPIPIDPDSLGLTPHGVFFIPDPETGITHVFDWIGSETYGSPADFVMEALHLGISRRLPRTIDFQQLSRESCLVFAHRRAGLDPERLAAIAQREQRISRFDLTPCPSGRHHIHVEPVELCARHWWQDLPDDQHNQLLPGGHPLEVVRTIGSTPYTGFPELPVGAHELAIFLRVPITAIEVVRDPAGGSHQQIAARAAEGPFPVYIVDR